MRVALAALPFCCLAAALGTPAYASYTTKAKVAAAYEASAPWRSAVELAFGDGVSASDEHASLPAYVASVRIAEDWTLEIALDSAKLPTLGHRNRLVLTPTIADGATTWRCASTSTVPADYWPDSCR